MTRSDALDVSCASSQGTLASHSESYNVLRQSLQDTNRRCESLSVDMLHQAEAQEEIVDTLGTVKDANKRLLDHIQARTEELGQLTRQRIADDERRSEVLRAQEAERAAQRREFEQRLTAVGAVAGERLQRARAVGEERLKRIGGRVQQLRGDASRFQGALGDLRAEALALGQQTLGPLAALSEALPERCKRLERVAEEQVALRGSIGEAREALRAEQELRRSDALSWAGRLGASATDREQVEARLARDLAQLGAHQQAAARLVETERGAGEDDLAEGELRVGESLRAREERRIAIGQLEQRLAQLECAVDAAKLQGASDADMERLEKRLRVSDDQLAMEVAESEQLRGLLLAQQRRHQDRAAQLLLEQREAQERRLATAARLAQGLRRQLQGRAAESEALGRDASERRAQHDAASALRETYEKELSSARHRFQLQALELRALTEQAADQAAAAEEERRQGLEELREAQRGAAAQDAQREVRQGHQEASLAEQRALLDEVQRRLRDVMAQEEAAAGEAPVLQRQGEDAKTALLRRLEEQHRQVAAMRSRLAAALLAEEESSQRAREDFERERDTSAAALHRLEEENRQRLEDAQRQRRRAEEAWRLEAADAGATARQLQQRVESLQEQLRATRTRLADGEANVLWARSSLAREVEAPAHRSEDGLLALRNAVSAAWQEDASLQRRLEMMTAPRVRS